MDPLTVARLWLLVKPVKRFRRWNQRRRGLPLDEVAEPFHSTDEEEPIVRDLLASLRTSTKAGAAGFLPLIAVLPFYEEINNYLLAACKSEQGPTVFLVGGAVVWVTMYVTARKSKTPAEPGKL